MGQRQRGTRPIGNENRKRHDQLQAAQRIRNTQARLVDDLGHEVGQAHMAACRRFAIALPYDPFLLDVLEQVEVLGRPGPDAVWLWHGHTSNKGTPVIRVPPSVRGGRVTGEMTAARWLAVCLGLIDANERGYLIHMTDHSNPLDVNPRHRRLHGKPLR